MDKGRNNVQMYYTCLMNIDVILCMHAIYWTREQGRSFTHRDHSLVDISVQIIMSTSIHDSVKNGGSSSHRDDTAFSQLYRHYTSLIQGSINIIICIHAYAD